MEVKLIIIIVQYTEGWYDIMILRHLVAFLLNAIVADRQLVLDSIRVVGN